MPWSAALAESFQHGTGRERGELDRGAAGQDRLGELLGLGADQDEVGEWRRLLECLQEGVLALVPQVLGLLDDEDPSSPLGRAEAGRADHLLADVFDQVLGPRRPQPDEVGVRRGIEQRAAAGVIRIGCALGEELGRERSRGRGLARASRAAEEVGVAGRRERRGHPPLPGDRRPVPYG